MEKEIKLRVLEKGDIDGFIGLISVFEAAFEMENFQHPKREHLEKVLEKEGFVAIVAATADEVIGGLTLYLLDQYYSPSPLGYLYDLAVLPNYQRKGIGKALLAFVQDYCRTMGCWEVYVQAERSDVEALAFYKKSGPNEEGEFHQFSYFLKGGTESL